MTPCECKYNPYLACMNVEVIHKEDTESEKEMESGDDDCRCMWFIGILYGMYDGRLYGSFCRV